MRAPIRLAWLLSLIATSAFAQNLYPNADFNDSEGAEGWEADPGFVHMQIADAADCPRSGSLVATSQALPDGYELSARGPCLAFATAATVSVRLVYRGGGASPPSGGGVHFLSFANGACLGVPFGSAGEDFQLAGAWSLVEDDLHVPAGGSLGVFVSGGGPDISIIEIDEIRVTALEYLYFDDFDGGGTCRWSSGME